MISSVLNKPIVKNSTSIKTFTGKIVDLANPRPADFCIEDIAHSLAFQCRWTGHTREFYSVAQHSVVMSFIDNPADAWSTPLRTFWDRVRLLHDAGEAYYGDLATPFKVAMGEAYQVVKQPIDDAIYEEFGLEFTEEQYLKHVKSIDTLLLKLEGEWLVGVNLDKDLEYYQGGEVLGEVEGFEGCLSSRLGMWLGLGNTAEEVCIIPTLPRLRKLKQLSM
jgi:hypothetical protein